MLNVQDGRLAPGSIMGFDPGVLVEQVDDPDDPDYAIGFRAYGAWGIQRASATELDQNTMYTPRYGSPDYPFWVPSMITSYLANLPKGQAVADDMKQHVQWAGIRQGEFIDFPAVAEGEDLDDFQFYEASSFRKIGNKYIYLYSGFSGHRAPRGFGFARQSMVAPVAVQADEKPVSEGGVVRITAYDPYKGAFTVKASDGSEYRGASCGLPHMTRTKAPSR